MPSARRKSLQKQLSGSSTKHCTATKSPSLSERLDRDTRPGYCQHPERSQSTKSRRVEYIKIAQRSSQRLTAREMALGFKDKRVLIGQVEEYNRRIQLPTFHIKGNFTSDDDVEYEGCLRFFLAHADNNFTKAVRLTSSTTWKSLKPMLLEKFNLIEGVESGKLVPILYAVKDSGESSVRDEDCPLVLALMASVHIQFVLKVYQEGKDPGSPIEEKQKLSQSNSFFSAMKKKINKTKSKEKISLQSSQNTTSKVADPVGPNPHKHGRQKSDSTGSIGSRKKSDASSKKSSASLATSNLKFGSAATARSMENLSKAGKAVKKKKASRGMNSSQSNMLAIDDAVEYITIHGDRVDLGADEVVVPIDGGMTVRDLIADVLEECEISLARVDDFALCDVIGREIEGLWLTDYARDMNDSEKPLLLISMMKPSEGLARRFEIKNVSKEDETGSQDTSHNEDHLSPFEIRDFQRHTSTSLSSISNVTDYNSQTLKFPTDYPYFLTIQSYDTQHDSVLHMISRTTSIIGRSEDEDKCNIRLYAPDILAQHCWVCQVYDEENETEYKCISLAPFPGAEVRINEEDITQKTNIKAGDIITLGQHYIFLFKDPTSPERGTESNSQSMVRHTLSGSSDEQPHKPSLYEENRQWHDVINHAMSLSFTLDKQDELLSKIFSIMRWSDEGYKLTPSYLIALAVDHARHAMRKDDLVLFLNKVSCEFQNIIWENTKHLQSSTEEMDSLNPVDRLNVVAPHLQCLMFWMANCIELRGYLSMNQATLSVAVGSTDAMDEIMNVLSDSVIYAFQQTVYHLTKVLYPTLDMILTDNPFSRLPNEAPTMNDTLKSLTLIMDIANNMALNISITQQLFSYLYFFLGTSLCNKMFEDGNISLKKESVSLYYNWEEGVKIRKNIELLENWSHDQHMEAANNYLTTVISVADFLATSKQFLLQASWHQLKNLYPLLRGVQLHHLLANYDLGNRQVPTQWCPPSDEVHVIMDDRVMVSFDDHPPLVMPSHSCINLAVRLEDKVFNQHLDYFNSTYGHHQSEDETDSGFDLGHSRSPTEVDDNSKSFGDHTKLGSRGSNNSHASEKSGGKSYTPIFKKKRQTPPPKRASVEHKVIAGNEYNNVLRRQDSSDEELSSQMEQISLKH